MTIQKGKLYGLFSSTWSLSCRTRGPSPALCEVVLGSQQLLSPSLRRRIVAASLVFRSVPARLLWWSYSHLNSCRISFFVHHIVLWGCLIMGSVLGHGGADGPSDP